VSATKHPEQGRHPVVQSVPFQYLFCGVPPGDITKLAYHPAGFKPGKQVPPSSLLITVEKHQLVRLVSEQTREGAPPVQLRGNESTLYTKLKEYGPVSQQLNAAS
jgi:hypothetical protein